MKTKHFTLKQLFALTDGRVSTSMDSVYEMLNFILDENFFTHHLPVAADFLQDVYKPTWFIVAKDLTQEILKENDYDFHNTMEDIRMTKQIIVSQITGEEKEALGFNKYMVKNSLLIKAIMSRNK